MLGAFLALCSAATFALNNAFARRGGHAYDARAATIADGRTAELLARVLG